MPSYAEWNKAIAEFSAGMLHPGDPYYLSVDEDVLMEIGASHFDFEVSANAVTDFERAVRAKCVVAGRVNMPVANSQRVGTAPNYIGFLAAMVLAAHRMAPEDDIAEINYFTRLREILGLPNGRGRPPGIEGPGAPEEPLWSALNNWVLRNGWLPSAQRGPDGPLVYTNYPLSQSLLRTGDKEKLDRDFRNAEHELGRYADRERVGGWFFNRATAGSTHHIRKLAQEASADRYDSIADAVYEVFTSVDWDRRSIGRYEAGSLVGQRRLIAGLYREFDPIFGDITYHLLPRQRLNKRSGDLVAVNDGVSVPLHRDSDGHFRPTWPVDPVGGQSYQIVGDPTITELFLPERAFWVLTRDMRDHTSATFASRGAPQLGQTFLLLCNSICHDQLNLFKDEGMLDWAGEPVDVPNHDGWSEYRECMVLSANWDGIIPQMHELLDELRPRESASISLQGGLKMGRRDAWQEGFQPHLRVTSFQPNLWLTLSNVSEQTDKPTFDDTINANGDIELPPLDAGDYLIQVLGRDGSVINRRHIGIMSWEDLKPSQPTNKYATLVGDHILRGGLLLAQSQTDTERGAAGW